MNKKTLIILVLAVLTLMVAYFARDPITEFQKGFQEEYRRSYTTSFTDSFQKEFVKSCVGMDNSNSKKLNCECFANKAIAQLTVEQLHDESFAIEYIKSNIVPSCLKTVNSVTR